MQPQILRLIVFKIQDVRVKKRCMKNNIQRPVVKTKTSTRKGKGYSSGELKEAGLTIQDAKRIGIYLDLRRKSVHAENVEYLKTIELKKK